MAKAKGSKGSKASSKPAAKKPAAKKPAAPAKKPAAPAKKPAAPAKKPAVEAPPAPSAAPAEAPAATDGLIKKKKVKRGAPPMLPRRLAKRPPPHAPGAPLPPPKMTAPGSLHAPARQPDGAEGLKVRLVKVMNELGKLRALKRNLNRQFFEMGLILTELSSPELIEAKGYGSWESFVEREIERELNIGRMVVEDMRRVVRLFNRAAAEELGWERLQAAMKVLFPEPGGAAAPSTRPASA
ncbi:MAG: hypothetical protein U0325_20670 [Polyangiales bacterium]